jgi:hypothetical protein
MAVCKGIRLHCVDCGDQRGHGLVDTQREGIAPECGQHLLLDDPEAEAVR